MIYITGDTHGNQYKWVEQIESVISPADIILVCGDFGVGFWNGRYWSEETFYDSLANRNILCCSSMGITKILINCTAIRLKHGVAVEFIRFVKM